MPELLQSDPAAAAAAAATAPGPAGGTPPPAARPQAAVRELGGPSGPEPTRYGDWEKNGRCIDF